MQYTFTGNAEYGLIARRGWIPRRKG